MAEYPDSACEAHRNVKTSEPVCVICMGNEIERLRAALRSAKAAMEKSEAPFYEGMKALNEAGA